MKSSIQEKFDHPILFSQNRQPLFSSARAPRLYFLLQKQSFWIWFYFFSCCFLRNNPLIISSILEENSLSRTCYGWVCPPPLEGFFFKFFFIFFQLFFWGVFFCFRNFVLCGLPIPVWKVFVPNFFQIVRNFCCGGYAMDCNFKNKECKEK